MTALRTLRKQCLFEIIEVRERLAVGEGELALGLFER